MVDSEVSGFDRATADAAEKFGVFPVDIECNDAPAVVSAGGGNGFALVSAASRADGLAVISDGETGVTAGPGVRVLSEVSR
jgi:molybdopterin biosynthesis enzyme